MKLLNFIDDVRIENEYDYERFQESMTKRVSSLFADKQRYRNTINSLRTTQKGLQQLIIEKPHLEPMIAPQFEALNRLLTAMLPRPGEYQQPPYYD